MHFFFTSFRTLHYYNIIKNIAFFLEYKVIIIQSKRRILKSVPPKIFKHFI